MYFQNYFVWIILIVYFKKLAKLAKNAKKQDLDLLTDSVIRLIIFSSPLNNYAIVILQNNRLSSVSLDSFIKFLQFLGPHKKYIL